MLYHILVCTNVLHFVYLTFASRKPPSFLCSLINAKVPVVKLCTYIEISTYFNVRHMIFYSMCDIGSLICKIHFIDGYITATFLSHRQLIIMSKYSFPDERFLDSNQTQSCKTPHWPLLHLVM